MTPTEERFSAALHNTARAWRQAVDRRLKYLGLGQASWMTIATVAKTDSAMSQTELANKLGVEDPTMVSMLDRLVKAGYLLRQPSATDRRVKLIVLTASGQDVYEKVRVEATSFRQEILEGVDLARLAELTRLLEQLQAVAEAAP